MSVIVQLFTGPVQVQDFSTTLLPGDSRRDFLHVQNNSSSTILIRFGENPAGNDGSSIRIPSGADFTFQTPGEGPIQAIATPDAAELTVTTNINF